MLQTLERSVLDSFLADTDSVLVMTLEDGFSRLLLHAICKYLGLESASEDADACRVTVVSNATDTPFARLVTHTQCFASFSAMQP